MSFFFGFLAALLYAIGAALTDLARGFHASVKEGV